MSGESTDLNEHDYVYDGFMHRPFQEGLDGWRNRLQSPLRYPCVAQAQSVLDLFNELRNAHIRIWELEQALLRYTPDLPSSRVG